MANGRTFGPPVDVIQSRTEDLFVRVAEAQAADINRVVAAARKAFDTARGRA